mmetsp:Transcript_3436/g.7143  ORF Transcript_3436/g.7143 Transcript_3436/m.7143 type:complete len:298 (+) Transcript_3436:338-1231(+)
MSRSCAMASKTMASEKCMRTAGTAARVGTRWGIGCSLRSPTATAPPSSAQPIRWQAPSNFRAARTIFGRQSGTPPPQGARATLLLRGHAAGSLGAGGGAVLGLQRDVVVEAAQLHVSGVVHTCRLARQQVGVVAKQNALRHVRHHRRVRRQFPAGLVLLEPPPEDLHVVEEQHHVRRPAPRGLGVVPHLDHGERDRLVEVGPEGDRRAVGAERREPHVAVVHCVVHPVHQLVQRPRVPAPRLHLGEGVDGRGHRGQVTAGELQAAAGLVVELQAVEPRVVLAPVRGMDLHAEDVPGR